VSGQVGGTRRAAGRLAACLVELMCVRSGGPASSIALSAQTAQPPAPSPPRCAADAPGRAAQVNTQKKKTGVIAPRRFVQRLKRDNELFRSYMHQVRLDAFVSWQPAPGLLPRQVQGRLASLHIWSCRPFYSR
jgi:hypothetical protein